MLVCLTLCTNVRSNVKLYTHFNIYNTLYVPKRYRSTNKTHSYSILSIFMRNHFFFSHSLFHLSPPFLCFCFCFCFWCGAEGFFIRVWDTNVYCTVAHVRLKNLLCTKCRIQQGAHRQNSQENNKKSTNLKTSIQSEN